VTLNREEWSVPDSLPYCGTTVVPFRAGTKLHWRLQDRHAA
jgi:dihydroorotase